MNQETKREWYVALFDEGNVSGLLGPVKGGEDAAKALMDRMLANDQAIVDAIDWEHPAVCAPDPFYESLQVIALSAQEINAMENSGRIG